MGIDEMGVDEVGVDGMGSRRSETTPSHQSLACITATCI